MRVLYEDKTGIEYYENDVPEGTDIETFLDERNGEKVIWFVDDYDEY